MSNNTNNNQENRIVKQGDFSYKAPIGIVTNDASKGLKPTIKPQPIKKK